MEKQCFFDAADTLPGATRRYKEEWEADLLEVGGKMFAMIGGDKQGEPILTVKLEPALGEALRGSHNYIVPGYYMNKTHWNSVYYTRAGIDEPLVMELLTASYNILLASLPKKVQAQFVVSE